MDKSGGQSQRWTGTIRHVATREGLLDPESLGSGGLRSSRSYSTANIRLCPQCPPSPVRPPHWQRAERLTEASLFLAKRRSTTQLWLG